MLVVDEVHHLLAGNYREQRAAMNLLKYLANDLRMSVVVVGTADAVVALQTDPQMSSRFTPMELPRWGESEESGDSCTRSRGPCHSSTLHRSRNAIWCSSCSQRPMG